MKFNKALIVLSLICMPLLAKSAKNLETPKQEQKTESQTDIKQLSLAIGHLLSKTINDIGISFDIDLVIQGLKDASNGISSPMSENDCVSAINAEQKKAFEALAAKNLKEAEDFLKQERKKQNVHSLENGKVLYTVLNNGSGDTIAESGKVSIRYKGSLLNGNVFGESSKDETIDISHLVSGLKSAMAGMKEGEKRLIHIHPDQGYGTEGMLPPNSLLSFEIEVAKAKVEENTEAVSEASNQDLETESEIR